MFDYASQHQQIEKGTWGINQDPSIRSARHSQVDDHRWKKSYTKSCMRASINNGGRLESKETVLCTPQHPSRFNRWGFNPPLTHNCSRISAQCCCVREKASEYSNCLDSLMHVGSLHLHLQEGISTCRVHFSIQNFDTLGKIRGLDIIQSSQIPCNRIRILSPPRFSAVPVNM